MILFKDICYSVLYISFYFFFLNLLLFICIYLCLIELVDVMIYVYKFNECYFFYDKCYVFFKIV